MAHMVDLIVRNVEYGSPYCDFCGALNREDRPTAVRRPEREEPLTTRPARRARCRIGLNELESDR